MKSVVATMIVVGAALAVAGCAPHVRETHTAMLASFSAGQETEFYWASVAEPDDGVSDADGSAVADEMDQQVEKHLREAGTLKEVRSKMELRYR